MKFTTQFALQSRGTWLWGSRPYKRDCRWQTGFSPSMILFSKRLTPTLSLALHLKITIQSQKPQLSNELIPVHSPLLRESYLVSYPPLTYMLKFSGFADLTSCLEWNQTVWKCSRQSTSNRATHDTKVLFKLLVVDSTCALNASRARSSLTHKHAQLTAPRRTWQESEAWISVDTEAGMLSGMSRKRSIRSNPYWFTEFCNSQCLSHFAAPFIVVRAETSVAESCISNKMSQKLWNYIGMKSCQRPLAAGTVKERVRFRPAAHGFLHGGIDTISTSTRDPQR